MVEAVAVGIIGAAGWLGRAFSQAIVDAGIASVEQLTLSYRSRRPDLLPGATWTTDNQTLADRSDIILLSVRPHDFESIALDTRDKLVISVMAGISLGSIAKRFQTSRVVRCLPNAAAEVGKSYTPWIGTPELSASDRIVVRRILESCGIADELQTEAHVDYFTGLTGSGPAFPSLLGSAMVDAAIQFGIQPDIANRAVNVVLAGTGRLMERTDGPTHGIVQTFLDYDGTTAAAIRTMRASGIETAVSEGLAAAFRKSVSMGQDAARDGSGTEVHP